MFEKIAKVFSVSVDYLLENEMQECIDVSGLPRDVIAHLRQLVEDLRKVERP